MDLQRIDREGKAWLEEVTQSAGFSAVGVSHVEFDQDSDRRFAEWVEAGRAGEMEWLKRTDEQGQFVRGDLRRSIPWAKSVIVCAANYNAEAPRSIAPAEPTQGWIARYAWSGESSGSIEEPGRGTDYHDTLLAKLRLVESSVQQQWPGVQTRCYVDTGPLLERDLAARSGIGWIGRNACVIHPKLGSYLLLAVVVTSLELEPEAVSLPAPDRCGSCTRCIDACPTDALLLPTAENPTRQMDATRCIAYLTIEKKGSIEPELRPLIGRQVFGCDICQDVCPWNRKAPFASSLPVRPALVNPELSWLASMDGPQFNRWFRGSPLERTRRKRVLRNVAIAMGNSGSSTFLPQLREWAEAEDEVLADAARWALEQLEQGSR